VILVRVVLVVVIVGVVVVVAAVVVVVVAVTSCFFRLESRGSARLEDARPELGERCVAVMVDSGSGNGSGRKW
jgi:Flp pilus assembly protein TadB